MSKQEEIREGIEDRIRLCTIQKATPIFTTNEILKYLHSQGIVIKVDKGLAFSRVNGTGNEKWYDGYKAAMDDYKEAGYVAVEPLIEEKE